MPHHHHNHRKILDVFENKLERSHAVNYLSELIVKLKANGSVTINNKNIELPAMIDELRIRYEILPKGEYSLKFDLIFDGSNEQKNIEGIEIS